MDDACMDGRIDFVIFKLELNLIVALNASGTTVL